MKIVEKLRSSAPTIDQCLQAGFSLQEANDFIASYVPTRRDTIKTIDTQHETPLLKFLQEWKLDNVIIGVLTFDSAPYYISKEKLKIGQVEADSLVLDINKDQVSVFEGLEDHLLWRVASSSSGFLNVLPLVAHFLGQRAVGLINFEDFEAAKKVAYECSALAGGEEYLKFYMMLLSAEE